MYLATNYNRTQALVLGFLVLAWIGLVAILVAAPEVYNQALRLPAGGSRLPELAFLAAISAFIILLGFGVSGTAERSISVTGVVRRLHKGWAALRR